MNSHAAFQRKKKGSVAIGIGVALLLLATVIAGALFLMQQSAAPNPDPNHIEDSAIESSIFPTVDWDYWQSINSDIVAWITVPGTRIDYPIVKASKENPTYYLNHDIFGNWNIYGCAYLDADCETMNSSNVVISAHHMNDGSMFSDFASFTDPSISEPAIILLQTPEWKKQLRIDGVDTINGGIALKQVTFTSTNAFDIYRANCLAQSDLCFTDSEKPVEQMFTFCTCSYFYWTQNERTLIYSSENG